MHFVERRFSYFHSNYTLAYSKEAIKQWLINGLNDGWRHIGDKPFSQAMMTQFTNANMRHLASMC